MPGGDLTKYSVAALRKAVQKHNKQVKTGKTGVYLYKLHSTKKAAIVRFLKKNFKVTRHRHLEEPRSRISTPHTCLYLT